MTTPSDNFPVWNLLVENDYLDSAIGWTWETRFQIDSANDPNRGVWEIFLRDNESGFSGTRIHFLAGGIDRDSAGNGVDAEYAIDLTDGFHVVRGAVEGGTNLTTVWVDGVKVIDALPSNEFDASEMGVIGRWGTQARGGTVTIDYIRFDTTGAYTPILAGGPPDLQLAVDASSSRAVLTFQSQPGDLFDIFRTVDLEAGFGTPLATDLPATEATTAVAGTINDFSGGTVLVDNDFDFDTTLAAGTGYLFIPGDGNIANTPSAVLSWSGNKITIASDYGNNFSWTGPYTIATSDDKTTWIDDDLPAGGRAFYQVERK
jgi:hypothetical protein